MTTATAQKNDGAAKGPSFDFTVDTEPFSTPEHVLTPEQIMAIAGIDPATHYLVLVNGRHQERLAPGSTVHMHNHMVFVSGSTGPTPTS